MYRVLCTRWGGLTKHAIVIGASLGGLCAARVLSDFYERVTVYERDELPDGPANRTAVPQGRHVHLLMARGAQEFDRLFPGLLDDMVAEGVPMLENRPDCIHFGAAGHVLGTDASAAGRVHRVRAQQAQLEWQIRRRVSAIDNVDIVHAAVSRADSTPRRQRVTGVLLDSGEVVAADLVVDAAGRGTRLPVWLEQWGFERPREETVDVGIGYATHQLRIPDGLLAEKVVVAGASREHPVGRWHALLRRRHLGRDDLRNRQGRAATGLRGDLRAGRRDRCPRTSPPRCGRAPRSARWRSTSTRPVGGAATTSSTASPPASSRSATPSSASIRPSARA